ncbi:MAG TPA: zinc ribbon domain-containing protein [Dehalococcoidia bacterium]|nr:zinc ribbon domain-containing protein [Dehalococcoidia bacterium]
MPVYEFACNACGAPISVFVRSINARVEPRCPRCGSADARRLISRVAVIKGEGSFDSLDDLDNFDESDPKAMARWARRMQQELGDDAGPEFEEMVERLERGESLEDDFDDSVAGDDDDL